MAAWIFERASFKAAARGGAEGIEAVREVLDKARRELDELAKK